MVRVRVTRTSISAMEHRPVQVKSSAIHLRIQIHSVLMSLVFTRGRATSLTDCHISLRQPRVREVEMDVPTQPTIHPKVSIPVDLILTHLQHARSLTLSPSTPVHRPSS